MPLTKSDAYFDITLPTGQHLYYSRIMMVIPAGGPQVRQCSFYLPIIKIDPNPWKENDLEATVLS